MYEYKCWMCDSIEQVSDEWQVRKIQIPVYVKNIWIQKIYICNKNEKIYYSVLP